MDIARCKRYLSPGRRAHSCPARPREQPIDPSLEGSRRRFRLLRVHSHSHGGRIGDERKRFLRGKQRPDRAESAAAVLCACGLHRVLAPLNRRCLFETTRNNSICTILPEQPRYFKRKNAGICFLRFLSVFFSAFPLLFHCFSSVFLQFSLSFLCFLWRFIRGVAVRRVDFFTRASYNEANLCGSAAQDIFVRRSQPYPRLNSCSHGFTACLSGVCLHLRRNLPQPER